MAGFTRSLVRDLGPRGITVNTVHPGPTDTDMNPADGEAAKLVGPGIAIGRYGRCRNFSERGKCCRCFVCNARRYLHHVGCIKLGW